MNWALRHSKRRRVQNMFDLVHEDCVLKSGFEGGLKIFIGTPVFKEARNRLSHDTPLSLIPTLAWATFVSDVCDGIATSSIEARALAAHEFKAQGAVVSNITKNIATILKAMADDRDVGWLSALVARQYGYMMFMALDGRHANASRQEAYQKAAEEYPVG